MAGYGKGSDGRLKIKTVARPEGSESRAFSAMVESPAFAILRGRLEAVLERERMACERADGELELRRAQGAVSALRMALGLPRVMLAEMKVANR